MQQWKSTIWICCGYRILSFFPLLVDLWKSLQCKAEYIELPQTMNNENHTLYHTTNLDLWSRKTVPRIPSNTHNLTVAVRPISLAFKRAWTLPETLNTCKLLWVLELKLFVKAHLFLNEKKKSTSHKRLRSI